MSQGRTLPSWQAMFAGVCGVTVVIVGTELDWGFGLSLFLGVLAAALVFAGTRPRRISPQPPGPRRPAELPPLRTGHQVMTVRDLGGGGLGEVVPRGTRGVVTGIGWGKVEASFTIYGALGARQVLISAHRADFHRM